jgi:hypothetical protein
VWTAKPQLEEALGPSRENSLALQQQGVGVMDGRVASEGGLLETAVLLWAQLLEMIK